MSDIKVGDRVRRVDPCAMACDAPQHQVGWEGLVTGRSKDTLGLDAAFLGDADAYERVETKDERIVAWEAIIGHPIFKECFNAEGTLLDAVRNRLVYLYEMEQTVNDLKGEDVVTTEAATSLSTVPNPGLRLEALKLALSYGCEGLTPEEMIEVAEKFAAWVEGR